MTEEDIDYNQFDCILDEFEESPSTTTPSNNANGNSMSQQGSTTTKTPHQNDEGITDDNQMFDLLEECYTALNHDIDTHNKTSEKLAKKKSSTKPETNESQQKSVNESMKEFINVLNNGYKEPAKNSGPNLDQVNPNDGEAMLRDMLQVMMDLSDDGEEGDEDDDAETVFGKDSAILKLLENFLQPDILQKPMEQLAEQYPIYLSKHGSSLSAEKLKEIKTQQKHANEVVRLYKSGRYPETLHDIIEAFRLMQEAGTPPDEIVKALTDAGSNMPDLQSMMGGGSLF